MTTCAVCGRDMGYGSDGHCAECHVELCEDCMVPSYGAWRCGPCHQAAYKREVMAMDKRAVVVGTVAMGLFGALVALGVLWLVASLVGCAWDTGPDDSVLPPVVTTTSTTLQVWK